MGASSSKDGARQLVIEEQVDFGTVLPNGIYTSTQQDFDLRVVRRFICERRLAPFYKGK
ncbi:hypothetical protein BX666DRAFT_1860982 [Dichotomocladium elegans]|nr:hypothetical protein BX666DRAFT_1860982 [Dichotomocladium elegans]